MTLMTSGRALGATAGEAGSRGDGVDTPDTPDGVDTPDGIDALDATDALDALQATLVARAGPWGGLDGIEAEAGPCSPLVHVHRLTARPARTGELARPLPAEVAARLGVDSLWSHQAEAIDLARAGRSVVVTT